jgi:hypothetical protein
LESPLPKNCHAISNYISQDTSFSRITSNHGTGIIPELYFWYRGSWYSAIILDLSAASERRNTHNVTDVKGGSSV